jgi:hypothetical protein
MSLNNEDDFVLYNVAEIVVSYCFHFTCLSCFHSIWDVIAMPRTLFFVIIIIIIIFFFFVLALCQLCLIPLH